MSQSPRPSKFGEFNNDDVMTVITRTGKLEPLDTNQITNRLQSLMNRKPKIYHVNPYKLMLEVCKGLKSGITTYDIDEYAANASASLSINNPYYLKIAARIAIDNHQKNTDRSFVDKMRKAYLYRDNDGMHSPLLDAAFIKYVEEHQDAIELMIDYTRDFLLDFFGIRTFQKSYSIKINERPIERPQDLFMRTAIDLNMHTNPNIEDELAAIKTTYDAISMKLYTHASPTYFNAGGTHKQYASCFLLGTNDSREGIMKTVDDMSQISKWAGGIGVHVNDWRSTGARIRKTNGKSSGIVPFLKIYNDTMCAFNQGGRRPGSAAIYLMPHHPDIMKFLKLRRNDGLETDRARDLFYALWIPDIFMERLLIKDSVWSLFDSDKCGDLSVLSGDAYRKRYLELEEKKMYSSQIDPRHIWQEAYETNKETGMPYVCFSDTANRSFMQKNLGTVRSSNLCCEIMLYSDDKEYAVCILSSIALPEFVQDTYSNEELIQPEESRRQLNHEFPKNPFFNFTKLLDVTKLVVTNLNFIIDKTYHPVPETKRSNDRHRPIGVGVQGLDDCYAKMRYPFASKEARDLNKKIFECLYYGALSQSSRLSRQGWQKLKKECKDNGSATIIEHKPDSYDIVQTTFTDSTLIPKNICAYPSMTFNGGSPIGNGIFHWEMCNITVNDKTRPMETKDLSGMFDWESLRKHIKEFGVKNSLLVALMPTASTSQLLGNNEAMEPYTSNIYKRNTQAGEYIVVKKYLMNDLYNLGLWNQDLKENILACEGSIQHIDGIPNPIKELYPTVWEIDQEELIQQAIDRQPFVDQAQSLNLYVSGLSLTKWNKLMFKAWRGGLKTGKYYLHGKPAVAPQKFTINPDKQKEMITLMEKNKFGTAFMEPLHEVCEMCSS